ncbi:MAG: hypothetical protein D3922_00255 [Candidatus Electrothrix sp. AR1]|nr:hypothetical protein [Candidatus Electrothrix sp. AR1]
MKNCFCTLFDSRYLDRGLALYSSLESTCENFLLWILCLDDLAYTTLKKLDLDCIKLVKLSALEEYDPFLAKVKTGRTVVEYYFTCKSCFAVFVLEACQEADRIIYMDADLYFFASPDNIYPLIGDNSIAITPHKFLSKKEYLEEYGRFNAGFLLFKRDENGLACLQWWRERCIEWCHDYPEHDRYADQKYIDRFSSLFEGVWSIENVGVNLAPWNVEGKKISVDEKQVYVNDAPLIFFHFHNLRSISKRVFDIGFQAYCSLLDNEVLDYIYKAYLTELLRQRASIGTLKKPLKRGPCNTEISEPQYGIIRTCIEKIRLAIMIKKGLQEGRYMIGNQAETHKVFFWRER